MNKKKKILVIVGKSCSGKDTLIEKVNELLEKVSLPKLTACVTYTTRPKRETETNYKEHIFVDSAEFSKIYDKELVAGTMIAYTSIDTYEYMTTLEYLNKSDIVILDPGGYKQLKDELSDRLDIYCIYIEASITTRTNRALKRCKNNDELDKYFSRELYESTMMFPAYREPDENGYFVESEHLCRIVTDDDSEPEYGYLKRVIEFLFDTLYNNKSEFKDSILKHIPSVS